MEFLEKAFKNLRATNQSTNTTNVPSKLTDRQVLSGVEEDVSMISSIASSEACDISCFVQEKETFNDLKSNIESELTQLKRFVQEMNEQPSDEYAPKIKEMERMLTKNRIDLKNCFQKLINIENENCLLKHKIELIEDKVKASKRSNCSCSVF